MVNNDPGLSLCFPMIPHMEDSLGVITCPRLPGCHLTCSLWHSEYGASALRLGCSMPACQDLSSRVVRLPGLSGSMRHEFNLEPPHTSDFCKLTCANSHRVPGLPGVPCFALPWLPLSHLLMYIHVNENNLHVISPCTLSKFVGVISGTFILRS